MLKIGADIGGTFTDVVMADEETGELCVSKYPTTTEDPSIGFTQAMDLLFDEKKIDFRNISQIVHASTLATNTLLQRKKEGDTALITTKGFRDVLEIQRQKRYDLYDIFIEKPKPVIPRHYIWEIDERISFDGHIVKEMDEEAVRSIVTELIQRGIHLSASLLLQSIS
jgi:N-methylhydantoinase A